MLRIIAIANQKGGVGKTTTAINLGHGLALADKSCLLVDIDPQANATSGLGVSKDSSVGIYQALTILNSQASPELSRTSGRLKDCIIPTSTSGLDLLPSTPLLAEIESRLHVGTAAVPAGRQGTDLSAAHSAQTGGYLRLKTILNHVPHSYDYILIDCPPSYGIFPLNALYAADGVIIPIQCEYFAMEGLTQILNIIKQVQKENSSPKIDGILLTMYDDNIEFSKEVNSEVRDHFSQLVYQTIIPRDITLAEASSFGLPVLKYEPTSRGAHGYIELAREVLSKTTD